MKLWPNAGHCLAALLMLLMPGHGSGALAQGVESRDSGPVSERIGGDFTLTDHDGQRFDLQQLRGQIVLIFFGYTYCPDICPTELASLAEVLRSVQDRERVSALFVSLDPERDTPEKLKEYVHFFSPRMIGLTGKAEEIRQVAEAYHVQYAIEQHRSSDEYYSVDHSANLYVVGGDGALLQIVPFGLPVEHIKEVLAEEISRLGQ